MSEPETEFRRNAALDDMRRRIELRIPGLVGQLRDMHELCLLQPTWHNDLLPRINIAARELRLALNALTGAEVKRPNLRPGELSDFILGSLALGAVAGIVIGAALVVVQIVWGLL